MSACVTLRRMPTVDMQTRDFVPRKGEIIQDATSNRVKIGDGRSYLKDLPWVTLGVDLAKEESSLSIGARAFLEDHIELIENNDYDTLYSHIATPALAQEVTRALLQADLNPEPYLSKIPDSIKHILEPGDTYTKQDLDHMMKDLSNKMFAAMQIPSNILNYNDDRRKEYNSRYDYT